MICPTCRAVLGGCPTCEGSGVVAVVVERAVTFYEACELVQREQVTGQPFHFLHGKPKLVTVGAVTFKITA